MDIKEKITKIRKQKGWSLSKLATQAGLTTTTVYNWYNDKNATPSRDSIEDVCVAFGISVAEFYADIEMDNLTEKEIRLLELFRKIPEKEQEKALSMLELLCK
ncbi:MAG: helix-turn-helix transcriptional regulator [Clostridiales bacterium]|nr:helix-turn-helix transcriptional regulator [Clostridiales bacterium]